jgi:hypothetical protein
MKKKLVFSGVLVLALVLTTGTFAYTYTTTTAAALGGTLADGAWATYETSAVQPDWQQIMPGGQYDSEILVPNNCGDLTQIDSQYPDTGRHWDKVDDVPADDAGTYISTSAFGQYETDLYNLTDHQPLEEGVDKTIKSITVFFRFAGPDDNGSHDAHAKAVIKTDGNIYEGTEEAETSGNFTTKSYEWRGNPATGRPWTWDEMNALQAGVRLEGGTGHRPAYATQVYVAVNYERKVTQSEVPAGDVFDITPHADYTGDLQITIYLTNTAALIKAYSYLNIELYAAKSVEAQNVPPFQILSLENGVASFNIEGGSAGEYTVEVIGGAYRLVSGNPGDWGAGWSIIPELYCEVSQR